MTNTANQPLLQPITLGDIPLRNRIVMAPMTRSRARNPALAPTSLHREYYRQRAGAGLIVSEGNWVSPDGVGAVNVPGIYSGEQINAWAEVTSEVHAAGGAIFVQIAHTGAYSHPEYRVGRTPAGPSAISIGGHILTSGGFVDMPTPRALTTAEIDDIIEQYRAAAVNARRANFDGVEVHAHRWYLIAQFLSPRFNVRTDNYGGSIENRARLLFDVLDAVTGEWPAGRVGIKLAPFSSTLDGSDVTREMWPAYQHVLARIADLPLAYLHLMGPQSTSTRTVSVEERFQALTHIRDLYSKPIIANGGFDQSSGNLAIAEDLAELVSYAQPFIANPDLPVRFARHLRLADGDPTTFYQGGARG